MKKIGDIVSLNNEKYVITQINRTGWSGELLRDFICKNVSLDYNGWTYTIEDIIKQECDKYIKQMEG